MATDHTCSLPNSSDASEIEKEKKTDRDKEDETEREGRKILERKEQPGREGEGTG